MSLINQVFSRAPTWLLPHGYVVRRGPRRCGRIALSFDDGPSRDTTPRVLDVLDQRGVKGTFFLVGEEVQRHPGLAREIVRRGHDVGSHSYSHVDLAAAPAHVMRAEIDRGRAVLEDATGIPVVLMRPPWGRLTMRLVLHAAAMGMAVVMWSVDSRDWMRRGQAFICKTIQRSNVRPGDIVLLHDDYAETVAALPTVLDELLRAGLVLGTLGELLVQPSRNG